MANTDDSCRVNIRVFRAYAGLEKLIMVMYHLFILLVSIRFFYYVLRINKSIHCAILFFRYDT